MKTGLYKNKEEDAGKGIKYLLVFNKGRNNLYFTYNQDIVQGNLEDEALAEALKSNYSLVAEADTLYELLDKFAEYKMKG